MRRILLSFMLAVAVAGPGITGIGVAALLAASVAFLYGGSRMVAADEQP